MKKTLLWMQALLFSGMLLMLPAAAKPEKDEAPPKYHSSIQAPKTDEKPEQLKKLAKITEKDAIQTATAKAGTSKFHKVELENEDGNVVYVVKFKNGTQEREIVVDAGNGKILADEIEKAD
ncbi:hypothetical protein ABS71_07310 [bacterium SCN 62-11]|nr:PepSY domain-containing protein [Candidatus Eremiobacteraeota bacterium]ODT73368.1 MAG: hypothetical protein ABS71_07310 [bacterium SCN 62-11]